MTSYDKDWVGSRFACLHTIGAKVALWRAMVYSSIMKTMNMTIILYHVIPSDMGQVLAVLLL